MLPGLQVRRQSQPASWDQAGKLGLDPGQYDFRAYALSCSTVPLSSPPLQSLTESPPTNPRADSEFPWKHCMRELCVVCAVMNF